MASPASETQLCAVCSKPAPLKCSSCKSIHYCDTDCQKEDFKVHKIICKVYSEFDMNTRPSPNHHLAFVFPEGAASSDITTTQEVKMKPKLVWIESTYSEEDECYFPVNQQVSDAMRDGKYIIKGLCGFLDNKSQPTPQDQFMLLWSDDFFQNGLTPRNPIIDKLVIGSRWRGPVLFQTGFGSYAQPTKYCDMSVRDMKRIAKFFKEYPLKRPRFS